MSISAQSKSTFAPAWIELLLILTAGLFIYGWKLGDAPLDRTEPHRALVAHQMVTSGQWFIPRLYGELYLLKPPLIYWIEGATEKLIGHGNEFVWRLPSAIGSALLAVILAMWSARWFGPFARFPTALACLALIPLWEQDRGADIDALNTVASVITAMVLVELLYGLRSRTWPWVIALTISLAATLMLKGPGGFPPILGALIGPSILLRNWKWLRRPGAWIGLITGIAIFAAYGITAKTILRHQGAMSDTRGVSEVLQRLVIHKWTAIFPAIFAPFTTLLYALPVSLALCSVADRSVSIREPARGKVRALCATLVAAFVIWIFAGNDNPRYEYVALPLLAPLVGAIAAAWSDGSLPPRQSTILRVLLTVFSCIWALITIGIIAAIWKRSDDRSTLATTAAISVIAGTLATRFWMLCRYRPAAIAWLAVILCLAIPLGERKNLERQKKSARASAAQLREIVHGQMVSVASMNLDLPELFYYADVPVHAFGEHHLDKLAAAPGGRWVVLTQNAEFPEFKTITAQIPSAFPHGITQLHMPDPRDKVFVGWYEPPPAASRTIKVAPASSTATSQDDD